MRVFGIAGFKNAGKTTLVVALVRLLTQRGWRVATVKHAHHRFDVDQPGKDSFLHREAGACEVIVASARRWAHIRETPAGPEATLDELLAHLSPDVDLVLVEGFKRGAHAKLEIRRAGQTEPLLAVTDQSVCAIVCDGPLPGAPVPVLPRHDVEGIAAFVLGRVGLPAAPPPQGDGKSPG